MGGTIYTNISLQNHVTHDRLVHLEVLYKPSNKFYSIIGTYCPAKNVEKVAFWATLNSFLVNVHNPWLLIGDFNEMLLHQDKFGGAPLKTNQLKRLPHLPKTHSPIDILASKKPSFREASLVTLSCTKDLTELSPTPLFLTTSIKANSLIETSLCQIMRQFFQPIKGL